MAGYFSENVIFCLMFFHRLLAELKQILISCQELRCIWTFCPFSPLVLSGLYTRAKLEREYHILCFKPNFSFVQSYNSVAILCWINIVINIATPKPITKRSNQVLTLRSNLKTPSDKRLFSHPLFRTSVWTRRNSKKNSASIAQNFSTE